MFELTKEQIKLQAQAKELSDGYVKSRAAEIDKTEEYPWDVVEKLTESGFMGMTIPKEYGGRGLSYFDAVLVVEQLGRNCGVSSRISVEANMGGIGAIMGYGSEEQKKLAMGIVGGVNIFAGIISTLQNFLRYAELMESHRSISVSWSKFSRNITVELALDTKIRKHAGDFLKICRAEFDRLIEQAPSVDDSIIKEFNKRFKEIDVIKPEICNGLHKCKIYKPTHEEKVELMVANAGSKLLEKRKDHLKTARSWKRNSGKLSKSEPLQGIKETSKSSDLDSPRRSLDLETASPNVKINITELEKINESLNDEDNRDKDIDEFIDAIEPNKNKI